MCQASIYGAVNVYLLLLELDVATIVEDELDVATIDVEVVTILEDG